MCITVLNWWCYQVMTRFDAFFPSHNIVQKRKLLFSSHLYWLVKDIVKGVIFFFLILLSAEPVSNFLILAWESKLCLLRLSASSERSLYGLEVLVGNKVIMGQHVHLWQTRTTTFWAVSPAGGGKWSFSAQNWWGYTGTLGPVLGPSAQERHGHSGQVQWRPPSWSGTGKQDIWGARCTGTRGKQH